METEGIRSITFWRNVKNELAKNKMSWQELAEISGLSAQSMAAARYLKSNLRVLTVMRIASALNVNPAELAGLETSSSKPRPKITEELIKTVSLAPPEMSIAMLMPALSDEDRAELDSVILGTLKMEGIV